MAIPEAMLEDWERLNEQNKLQTRTFIRFLLNQQREEIHDEFENSPFKPMSEEQLWRKIDRSLSRIAAGEDIDAEMADHAIMAKYGIEG